jgi:hypothetical protein
MPVYDALCNVLIGPYFSFIHDTRLMVMTSQPNPVTTIDHVLMYQTDNSNMHTVKSRLYVCIMLMMDGRFIRVYAGQC